MENEQTPLISSRRKDGHTAASRRRCGPDEARQRRLWCRLAAVDARERACIGHSLDSSSTRSLGHPLLSSRRYGRLPRRPSSMIPWRWRQRHLTGTLLWRRSKRKRRLQEASHSSFSTRRQPRQGIRTTGYSPNRRLPGYKKKKTEAKPCEILHQLIQGQPRHLTSQEQDQCGTAEMEREEPCVWSEPCVGMRQGVFQDPLSPKVAAAVSR